MCVQDNNKIAIMNKDNAFNKWCEEFSGSWEYVCERNYECLCIEMIIIQQACFILQIIIGYYSLRYIFTFFNKRNKEKRKFVNHDGLLIIATVEKCSLKM